MSLPSPVPSLAAPGLDGSCGQGGFDRRVTFTSWSRPPGGTQQRRRSPALSLVALSHAGCWSPGKLGQDATSTLWRSSARARPRTRTSRAAWLAAPSPGTRAPKLSFPSVTTTIWTARGVPQRTRLSSRVPTADVTPNAREVTADVSSTHRCPGSQARIVRGRAAWNRDGMRWAVPTVTTTNLRRRASRSGAPDTAQTRPNSGGHERPLGHGLP